MLRQAPSLPADSRIYDGSMNRNLVSALVLVALLGAIGGVLYGKFGPRTPPTKITVLNATSKEMGFALTRSSGESVKFKVEPGGNVVTDFQPGVRMDVYFGSDMLRSAGAWVIDNVGGQLEIASEGPEVTISGNGLETRDVQLD